MRLVCHAVNTHIIMASSQSQGGATPRGRKLTTFAVSEADRTQLQGVANSTTMPHALVLRARMILASAEGITNAAAVR